MTPEATISSSVGHGLALTLYGMALGLGAAMPIGPVNVEIARRSLRSGVAAGVALGCGAITVDVIYALLYWLGVEQFTREPAIYWTLAAAGVILLTYLGIKSLASSLKEPQDDLLDSIAAPSLHGGYATGVLMTATNPLTVAYWFSVLPSVTGNTGRVWSDLPIICLGVLLGTLSWVVFLSTLLGLAGTYRKPWWLRVADALGGSIMLALAALALWRAIRRPL